MMKSWWKKFLVWRVRHIRHQQFILILSVVVGILSGIAAITIKNTTHYIQDWLQGSIINSYYSYLYFLYPVVGILLVVLFLHYVLKLHVGHGIPGALYAISRRNGLIKAHNMFSSIITSALTVGFGGSAGLEGPSVATGSAIGSNLGHVMHLNYKSRILMIGCAAAGTMSAIFNAPIAAIVFAVEVLMLDLTLSSIVPLLISSASASIFSRLLVGGETVFAVNVSQGFELNESIFFILLGVICGLISIYVTRTYHRVSDFFKRFENPFKRWVLAGLGLGLLIFLMPPLYGEGYETINALLAGKPLSILEGTIWEEYGHHIPVILALIFGLVLFKIVATSLTFAAGGIGGIFAPTLFMGSALGFVFAFTMNWLTPFQIELGKYALIGMAGLMAGVLHAPLTAIFLIAELTGGYGLFVPLMITASIAFITSRFLQPHSIYNKQLGERGDLLTHHTDNNVLTLLQLSKLIERNFLTIGPQQTLGDLVEIVAKSKRNIFPVLDEDQHLLGIVTLDDIRSVMFDQDLYGKVTVRELMHAPLGIVDQDESMTRVMQKFRTTGAWNLAVTRDGKYDGFISKSRLFSAYRSKLQEFSQD